MLSERGTRGHDNGPFIVTELISIKHHNAPIGITTTSKLNLVDEPDDRVQ
jgi:hypothetical protein